MENVDPPASSGVVPINTVAPRKFSKAIALTYVGLGYFSLILVITSVRSLYQAVVSRHLLLLIPHALLLSLSIGFMYVMLALHQRLNWARHAAVLLWVLCLKWTAFTIVRNGLHQQSSSGRLQYSNAEQLAGAGFAALLSPFLMAILELAAIYCLLLRSGLVTQFSEARPTRLKM